jgi:Arc/MetJ family transcription regulator
MSAGLRSQIPSLNRRISVRTTIDIDDQLMAEAMRLSGARTKKQAVEQGLRLLIRARLQEQVQVRRLRGRIPWSGDLEAMRRD